MYKTLVIDLSLDHEPWDLRINTALLTKDSVSTHGFRKKIINEEKPPIVRMFNIRVMSGKARGDIMKKVLIGLLALGSISAFSSELPSQIKCINKRSQININRISGGRYEVKILKYNEKLTGFDQRPVGGQYKDVLLQVFKFHQYPTEENFTVVHVGKAHENAYNRMCPDYVECFDLSKITILKALNGTFRVETTGTLKGQSLRDIVPLRYDICQAL